MKDNPRCRYVWISGSGTGAAAYIVGTPNSRGDAAPLDQVDHPLGVEAGLDDHLSALEQGGQAGHVQRGGVEHGCGDEGDLVTGQVDVDEDEQVQLLQERMLATLSARQRQNLRDALTACRHSLATRD